MYEYEGVKIYASEMEGTQEEYEAIREFFSRPNAVLSRERLPSTGPEPQYRCYYRHPKDPTVRCAIGCRIPDEAYDPHMDEGSGGQGLSFDTLTRNYIAISRLFADCNLNFLDEVQMLHDRESTEDATHFVTLLDELARKSGLEIPDV